MLQFSDALRQVVTAPHSGAITGFTFVARIPQLLHHTWKSVYVRTHPNWKYIKMAKNSRMALCCQNRVSKGTGRHYGLHNSASISAHSAFVTVLGLLKKKTKKKKESVQNGVFAVFRLDTCNNGPLTMQLHAEWLICSHSLDYAENHFEKIQQKILSINMKKKRECFHVQQQLQSVQKKKKNI